MDTHQKRRLATLIATVTNHLGLVDAYGLFRRLLVKSQVAVLTYHRVGYPDEFPWNVPMVTTQDFENQMRYLRKTYKILSLDTLMRYIQQGDYLLRKAVVITFDDGCKNNFTYAYPILKKYNVPATINLITDHIGSGDLFWWDQVKFALWNTALKEIDLDGIGKYRILSTNDRMRAASNLNDKLKKMSNTERGPIIHSVIHMLGVHIPANLGKELILSWDDVIEMGGNGITFGAHSLTHPNLTRLSLEEARYEISQSKRDVEERLGHGVDVFCYPNSDFNTEIVNLVKEEGFRCGLTAVPGMVNPKTKLYELGRISGGWNLNTLKLFLCGVYSDFFTIWQRLREA